MDSVTQTDNIAYQLKLFNGKLWYTIGKLNENEELYEESIECFSTALKHNPQNLSALSHLARIYKIRKRYLEAIFTYDKYLKISCEDGVAWMNLGECFLALEELNKAHQCLKNANKFVQKKPQLWFQLGNLYEKAGMFDYAESYYKKVLESSFPENASELHFKMAMIYKQHARYSECYEILTNECWNNPPEGMTQEDILCQLVQLYQLVDSVDIYRDAYDKALNFVNEHESPFVYILLGWLTHLVVMNPDVNEIFHVETDFPYQVVYNVIQKDPTNILGLYQTPKHQQNAFEAFHQALKLDQDNPLYWCSIGNLYFNTGQYSEAIKAYFKAISLSPQLPEVWYNMDAMSSFKRAHELEPKNPKYRVLVDNEKMFTNERPQIIDPSPFATMPHFTIETYIKPAIPSRPILEVLTELQKITVPDLTQ
ncbi:Tetratricopeptide repeat protein [Entamoeba marina]